MRPRVMLLAVLVSVLILISPVLPVPILAAEANNGRVEGLLVNGTNDSNVPDQEVTLKTYLNDNEIASKTARTDTTGQFVFEGLATSTGYSYDIALTFQEADYTSERVNFEDGTTTKTVKITVYDSTASTEAIAVNQVHTIVYVGEDDSLEIVSYALVTNSANLTYIGSKELAPGKKETLRFVLPKGAKEVQYGLSLMVCCVIPGEESFSDTMAILPGSKEVAYSYRISSNSGAYTLTQHFDYPTAKFDLLVQGNGISVANDRLTPEEPVTFEDKQFSHFSAQDIAAGDLLNIELSGLPTGGRQQVIRWLLLGLVVLAFAFGVVYLVRRKEAQPVPVRVEDNLARQKQKLLTELARLDDNFEAGRMAEAVYQRQRAEKKRRLLKLMQMPKE